MYPIYEKTKEEIWFINKKSNHVPPHLHNAFEIVYVTEGTVEFGVGRELYHMEKGDIGIVFPNLIHHYQVFGKGTNTAYYIIATPTLFGNFSQQMQKYCPINPVIKKKEVHPDIVKSLKNIAKAEADNTIIKQAYLQIILARMMETYELVEKENDDNNDIIYNAIVYVVTNFKEDISLERMASDLGVSKYVLSRIFSKTIRSSFTKYVNKVRLNHATIYLENTSNSITEIAYECGFESQRTFNRVFKELYKMTPKEYRNKMRLQNITNDMDCKKEIKERI